MIINFSVQNFHSIKDKVTLSFEATAIKDLEDYYIIEPKPGLRLLKLGLIYGANASGKTTILKALDFLRNMVLNPFEKKTDTFNFNTFLFDEKTPKENTIFTLEFIKTEVKYLYEVELNKQAVINEKLYFFNPNKALVYNRKTDTEKQLTTILFGNKIKINKEHKVSLEANTLWNNTVLGGFFKTNIDSWELFEVTDWFDNKLSSIIKPNTDLLAFVSDKIESNEINKNNIVVFLKKADLKITDIFIKKEDYTKYTDFIKQISDLRTISESYLDKIIEKGVFEIKEIQFQHTIGNNNFYKLPYTDESAGTQRYYQFSGLLDLMIRGEMIIPIDELESSLHPDLLKHFLLTFLVNSKHSQLIATTHYRELLMEKDIIRNDAIWFTEKKEDGSTDLFSLADFDSSVIRNTSSVYNAYKIGKLGAVPNLSDYYIDREDGKE
jgi:hypothetical protein